MLIEIKLLDFLVQLQQLNGNNQLIKDEVIVENVPLEPLWKDISNLLLEKIKHLKKCTTVRRPIEYSLDLTNEQEIALLNLMLQLTDSGDARINEKVSTFTSELLAIVTITPTDFNQFLDNLHSNILKHWERNITQRPALLGSSDMINVDATTGWQRLECFVRFFHAICLGILQRRTFRRIALKDIADSLESFRLEDFLLLSLNGDSWFDLMISRIAKHQNRYFRELTFHFISDIFPSLTSIDDVASPSREKIFLLARQSLLLVPDGLEDDWSQIRYASTKALHAVLGLLASYDIFLGSESSSETEIAPISRELAMTLLPRLCLNRFHPAKSVQTLSLEAWKTHYGREGVGRRWLAEGISDVIAYYIRCTRHQNHMICEAACLAIGEVVSKLTSSLTVSLVEAVSDALLICLNDMRWPVRDAALLPSGLLFRLYSDVYPTIITTTRVHLFLPLWRERLQDSIWSVRENAAVTIVEACQCLNQTLADVIIVFAYQYIEEHLFQALSQKILPLPPSSSSGGGKTSKITSFLPPAMLLPYTNLSHPSHHDIPSAATSDQSLPSSSLKKGWGCCIDCAELRKASEWEISHGAFYLLRELFHYLPSFTLSQTMSFSVHSSQTTSVERRESSVCDAISEFFRQTDYEHAEKLQVALVQQIPLLLLAVQERGSTMTEQERVALFESIGSWLTLCKSQGIAAVAAVANNTSNNAAHKAKDGRVEAVKECVERLQLDLPWAWPEIQDYFNNDDDDDVVEVTAEKPAMPVVLEFDLRNYMKD
eukprot:gene7301-7877_t